MRKYQNSENIELIDNIFREQREAGVIERIPNLDQFIEEHPECSFLPHFPVFRLDKETTKCRVVYMSNLTAPSGSETHALSHNQTILSGPDLNKKISTSLTQLRFDKFMFCYDLVKAFLQLGLEECDSNRLCFLWYANPTKGDFSIVAYRLTRVPFGLRCSPALLMVSLYFILIFLSDEDTSKLKVLKEKLYNLHYMDNGSYSSNDQGDLEWAYGELEAIFGPFGFSLQQYVTNSPELQSKIDMKFGSETPIESKLLGSVWNRVDDTLSTEKLTLNAHAKTKSDILSSIASNFDILGINSPILNRARLFLHRLQVSTELGWKDKLQDDDLREWRNICNQ